MSSTKAGGEREGLAVLEAMVEQSGSPIAYLDRDLEIVRVNAAYVRRCGRSSEELVGRDYVELSREIPHGGGTVAAVRDDAGTITGFVLSLVDGGDERARRLARAGQVGLYEWDTERRVIELDAEAQLLLGHAPGAHVTSEEWLAYLEPGDRDKVSREIAAPLGHARCEVVRVVHADGAVHWLEITSEPALDGVVRGAVRDVTERKRTEDAAAGREAQFRALIENVNAGVALIDTSGRFSLYNQRFLEMFGLASDSDLHNVNSQVWSAWSVLDEHGRVLDFDEHPVREAVLTQRPVRERVVKVRRPADGEYLWMVVTAEPLFDSGGRLESVICTYHDITDRMRGEAALARMRGILSEGERIAHVGSFEYLVESKTTIWSDEEHRIYGLDPAGPSPDYEVMLANNIHPDDATLLHETFAAALRTGGVYDLEHRIVLPDGSVRWVHDRAHPYFDCCGKLIRYVGTTLDITERRATEVALRASEARWNAAIEHFGEAAIIATDDEELVYWNPAARAMHGFTEPGEGLGPLEEVARRFELWTPDGSRRLSPDEWPIRRVKRGETVRNLEVRIRRPDQGWERIVAFSGATVGTSSGERLIFITAHDLTAQRRAEDELRRLNKEMALAAERKDEFLAVLSHELRNPLTPIHNSLYLLEGGAADSEQTRKAQAIIGRQVAHLTRLVDDLLDVTRIARGKLQMHRVRVELGDIVRRTVEDHRATFSRRGISLHVNITTQPLWLNGDATRIAQTVGNLLNNAAKFTPAEGRVDVVLRRKRDVGVLQVKDTGVGIASEMTPRIFEPFTQAEQALDRRLGGLGLGLALVKGIVESHGGSIEASSAGVGRGSLFTLCLPLEAAPAIEDAFTQPATRAQPHRVLIIEDNHDAAESLRDALQLSGHAVEIAYDGPSGIEKALTWAPNVVICDIGLPGMNGYEVARALRASPSLGHSLLIALTGYALPDDIRMASEAGFDRHLAKPPRPEMLQEALAQQDQAFAP